MSEIQNASGRISVEDLAEAVTSGVLRAVERRVDIKAHLADRGSLIVNPIIRFGGPFLIGSADQLQGIVGGQVAGLGESD
jgi:hypothetical protein